MGSEDEVLDILENSSLYSSLVFLSPLLLAECESSMPLYSVFRTL